MKIRLEMEIDLTTGIYDVRFHNVSHPGEAIDLHRLTDAVQRVLSNIEVQQPTTQVFTPSHKLLVN